VIDVKKKIIVIIFVYFVILSCFNISAMNIEKEIASDCSCNNTFSESKSTDPFENRCGFIIPDNWEEDACFDPCPVTYDLPPSFDWRTEADGLPPIEDQTIYLAGFLPISCGSCWAFATTGVFECLIKIRDGETVDLSEQYLISCNKDGWGCDGGFVAHKYHFDTKGKCDNKPGAVLENNFPYQNGWNLIIPTPPDTVDCKHIENHPYKIDSWSYIYPRINDIPEVENIQQAIYQHGPVYSGIYAGSAFDSYKSGIFSTHEGGDKINHAVVIVGWDGAKDDPNGYWIIRNSWGSDWGENGYMKIKYECSNIGHMSNYIKYKDPEPDLKCSGSLSWSNVAPGSRLTGSFTVKNVGDARSTLTWEILDYPKWGTSWSFSPEEDEGLVDSQTVSVSVNAPYDEESSFSGVIKVVNSDDKSDYDTISLSLETSKSKTVLNTRFINLFDLFQSLKNFLNYRLNLLYDASLIPI